MRVGAQLKSMPTRVTVFGAVDSAAPVVMTGIGVKEPAPTSESTPFCTWTCAMLPSASAAKKTALCGMARSGDLVASAVAMTAVVKPSVGSGGLSCRLVMEPANNPPAIGSGAPASGMPLGSVTLSVPSPLTPLGAFANHGRPNPLLSEMPSGRLTDGRSAVTAPALLFPFRNAGLWAVYRITAPPSVYG